MYFKGKKVTNMESNVIIDNIQNVIIENPKIDGKLMYSNGNINMTNYQIPGLLDSVKTIPEDNWILLIKYSRGDYQIGVTGKIKIKEKSIDTVRREVYEELHLGINYHDLNKVNFISKKTVHYNNKWKDYYNYTIPLDVIDSSIKLLNKDYRRDTPNKISAIIYGEKNKMENILDNVLSNIHSNYSEEKDISSACIMKKNEAINIMEVIEPISFY